MKPSASVSSTYDAVISAVLADDAANQARAEGAPQQTVVNGWTARDLLAIIAKQGSAPSATDDPRPAALLGLAVIGIALLLFTGGGANPQTQKSSLLPKTEAPPSLPSDVSPPTPDT